MEWERFSFSDLRIPHQNRGDSLPRSGNTEVWEENGKPNFENLLVPQRFPKLSTLASSLQIGCCLLSVKGVHKVSQCVENKFAKDK